MFSRRAWASSSLRVGSSPRLTADASYPSAVRVDFGRFFRVCLLRAPDCAFFTFLREAWRGLVEAIPGGYPERTADFTELRATAGTEICPQMGAAAYTPARAH